MWVALDVAVVCLCPLLSPLCCSVTGSGSREGSPSRGPTVLKGEPLPVPHVCEWCHGKHPKRHCSGRAGGDVAGGNGR